LFYRYSFLSLGPYTYIGCMYDRRSKAESEITQLADLIRVSKLSAVLSTWVVFIQSAL